MNPEINILLDPVVNFGKVTVSTGYTDLDIIIVLNAAEGSKLPNPSTDGSFNLVWYNSTDYPDTSDDPFVEIVRCTTRSEDILTVTRGEEGTVSSNKNIPTKTYKMILSPTKKTITDIQTDINASVKKIGDTMTGTLNLPANGFAVGTNQLIVSGSNVGIGTTTPLTKLHIFGKDANLNSAYFSGDNINQRLAIASAYTRLDLGGNPVTITGNVGIGTISPGAGLELYKNIGLNFDAILIRNPSTENGMIERRLILGIDNAYSTPPAAAFIGTNSNTALHLVINGGSDSGRKMTIDTSGNVGIGTITPTNPLTIINSSNNLFVANFQNTTTGVASSGLYVQTSNTSGSGNNYALMLTSNAGAKNLAVFRNDGNVGIGTITPVVKLDIYEERTTGPVDANQGTTTIRNTGRILASGVSLSAGLPAAGAYAWIQAWYPFNTYDMPLVLQPVNGKVGIGITNPTYQLQLSTDLAAKLATNTWTISSDERIKKDIRPFTDGISTILNINPIWYKYNGKAGFKDDNKDHIGVIGQEIKDIAPYTIDTYKAKLNEDDKEETELLNFNSHALTFVLINAVKELNRENDKLKDDITMLRKELVELRIHIME